MIRFNRRNLHLIVPGVLFCLIAGLSLLSEGYFGGADNISHYFISHYAFKYPHLFLSAWGRPVYTIISAPFALFGLQTVKLLNVMLGVATAWYAWRIAVMLKIHPAWPAMIFVCFAPLYFVMMPTALTEILFSFLAVISAYFFLKEKYIVAAILFSLLPFARSEGYLLIPIFLVALLWVRQLKAIPFLATGIIFFSLAGWICFGDILCLINRFPYPVNYTHPIYHETGSLWHFFNRRNLIIGLPLEILFLAGVAGMIRDLFSRDGSIRNNARLLGILVFSPFLGYLALHSFLYWKAMGGSMGLERVMAAVLPLAAIVSLKGLCEVMKFFSFSRWVTWTLPVLVTSVVVVIPFITYKIPTLYRPRRRRSAGQRNG